MTESKRRKETPLFSGFVCYFPDAMAEVARLSLAGNTKHNPREPLHHARGKSTDHGDCIVRHQVEFDQIDAEDGFYHAVKVAWRSMAQLQELLEQARGLPLARGARAAEKVTASAGVDGGLHLCRGANHGCLNLTSHPTGWCTVCWRLGWPTKA